MKKLSFIDKIIYFLNIVVATVLLLSYILPYVQPKNFSLLSVLSLTVPILILINAFFLLYWLLKVKKQLLVSLIVLLLGYNYVISLYKFSSSKAKETESTISIMNYNVRLFNIYNWIDQPNIEIDIVNMITEKNPDIVCFQEYHPHKNLNLLLYSYKYEKLAGKNLKYGQAIYSKYPIINKGSVGFPNSANNAIFIDIATKSDTLRIYNVHLQSSRIDANVENLDSEKSEQLLKSLKKTFAMQQSQAELFIIHKSKSPYKVIVAGDFNNTAYSYVYNEIRGNLKDAFEEAGNGFGRTFSFKYFPVRIDFILVDKSFEVNSFKTIDKKLSDHYPIFSEVILHQ